MLKNSYWNGNGKFQKEYDEFFEKLVPPEGEAKTMKGELLRSVSSIYYDCYNNGFCNIGNLKSKINYLLTNLKFIKQYVKDEYGVRNYLYELYTQATIDANGDEDDDRFDCHQMRTFIKEKEAVLEDLVNGVMGVVMNEELVPEKK